MEAVQGTAADLLQRGFPTVSDLEKLAVALGTDVNEELLQPIVRGMLARQGMNEAKAAQVASKARLEVLGNAREAIVSMLQRGCPTLADLEALTVALSLDVDQDFLRPLVQGSLAKQGFSDSAAAKVSSKVTEGR